MAEEKNKTLFRNREEASEALIAELATDISSLESVIVLSVSEGGVFFADRIAKKVGCTMDILLTEPIYSPINKNLAIAMVGETEEVVIHRALTDAFDISKDYIYREADLKYRETIIGYIEKYRDGEKLKSLDDKYVILTDECVETGLTMMSAVKTAISLGAKNIFIATPVLDNVVYENLVTICDNIFCPHKIDDYISVEYYYEELEPFGFDKIDKIMQSVMNKYEKGNKNNE
jgi:putative phosphoribosyl transferase